jgi:hypothetical protein
MQRRSRHAHTLDMSLRATPPLTVCSPPLHIYEPYCSAAWLTWTAGGLTTCVASCDIQVQAKSCYTLAFIPPSDSKRTIDGTHRVNFV